MPQTRTRGSLDSIFEALEEQYKGKEKERSSQSKRDKTLRSLLRDHVLPHMPRALGECYRLAQVNPGWGEPVSYVHITFKPTIDVSDGEQSRLAVGAISKVRAALEKAGWVTTTPPEPTANDYTKAMDIEFSMQLMVGSGGLLRSTRTLFTLNMKFAGLQETDVCRLVEKDVIIAAHYEAERTEIRLVVECNEEVTPVEQNPSTPEAAPAEGIPAPTGGTGAGQEGEAEAQEVPSPA